MLNAYYIYRKRQLLVLERWTPKTGQWLRCELLINMSPQGGHHDKAQTT